METTTIFNPYSSYTLQDHYIPAILSTGFGVISIIISIFIILLICLTKPRLHTVNHLLICNTSITSIIYCSVAINNFIFLFFIRWDTSNVSCRWRAYFTYLGMSGIVYSYLIQAISRFFFSQLSIKYRWVTKFKTHYILISIQWIICLILPSSTVITKDIIYSPTFLCWIPKNCALHFAYASTVCYGIPVSVIIIIYPYIYYRTRQLKRNSTIINNVHSNQKRDIELLRNIVILISIYLAGGLSSIVTVWSKSKIPYLVNLASQSLAVLIAQVCTIILDREIRQVIKSIICRTTPVMPFTNEYPARKTQQSFKLTNQKSIHPLQTNIHL